MSDLSASKSLISSIVRSVKSHSNSTMEMGQHYCGFCVRFSLTQKKHDSGWVIVDKLTNFAHFLPVRLDYSMDRLAELYVIEIVWLHGIPLSIVFDSYPWFTSRFWKELQLALGTQLNFSTAFHLQTDGQSEKVI